MQDKCALIASGRRHAGKQGLDYIVGILAETVGAHGLHMQLVPIPPGAKAFAHRHVAHETAIYALSGTSAVWHGDNLEHHSIVSPGNFFYIPANVPHVPYNANPTEPVIAVIARTDPNEQESVELLPTLEALDKPTKTLQPGT